MEWDKDKIELTVDDDPILTYTDKDVLAEYFNKQHFILLNIAMGGTLGGTIPNDFDKSKMEIDYVRVYQKSDDFSENSYYPVMMSAKISVDNNDVDDVDLSDYGTFKKDINVDSNYGNGSNENEKIVLWTSTDATYGQDTNTAEPVTGELKINFQMKKEYVQGIVY